MAFLSVEILGRDAILFFEAVVDYLALFLCHRIGIDSLVLKLDAAIPDPFVRAPLVVAQLASTMLHVFEPLPLVYVAALQSKSAVAMAHIIMPIAFVLVAIGVAHGPVAVLEAH